MKKNPQNNGENKKIEDSEIKKGFFKKVWYSIDKIDKYSELSAEGFVRAIKYLAILILIISIISALGTVYRTSISVRNISKYIEDNSPELTYSDGTLKVENDEAIIDENNNEFGKVIIDTNTNEEDKINEYINNVNSDENAIIILKDRLIIKEVGMQQTTSYNYKSLFGELNITEFNKSDLVSYLTSSNMLKLYFNLFVVLFIYAFIIYFINTLLNVAVISIFGYLTTIILKLKIKYRAVFNMAVYSITLPTILNIIYLIVNTFYSYKINYFDVMYVLISSIYMIAAIFILKSDFNKKQAEVQKIVEVEKEVKSENKEEEQNSPSNEENKNDKKDKEEKEEKNNPEDGEEPEGSNA